MVYLLLDVTQTVLVEFHKFLLMVKHFLDELFSASTPPELMAKPHLAFKVVQGSPLFPALIEDAFPLVEFSVHQLLLKEMVAVCLGHQVVVCLLVSMVASQDGLSQLLLDRVDRNEIDLELGLLLHKLGCVLIFYQLLQLIEHIVSLVILVCLSHIHLGLD
jgi:hypothetical protein